MDKSLKEAVVEQVSSAVQTRMQMARSFTELIERHGGEILSEIGMLLYGRRDDRDAMVQARHVIWGLSHAVEDALKRLIDADVALKLEAEDDKQYRDARDIATERLRAVVMDVRGLLEAAYGASILSRYGLDQDMPRSPEILHDAAEALIVLVRERPIEEPSPYGFELDLGILGDKIETELVPLSLAMDDIRREVREIQEALKVRNEAMSDFDRIKEATAQALAAYFRLVNRPDLAMMLGSV